MEGKGSAARSVRLPKINKDSPTARDSSRVPWVSFQGIPQGIPQRILPQVSPQGLPPRSFPPTSPPRIHPADTLLILPLRFALQSPWYHQGDPCKLLNRPPVYSLWILARIRPQEIHPGHLHRAICWFCLTWQVGRLGVSVSM